jgi:hypothetical protein
MKIYTYYHEIFDSMLSNDHQKELIKVWKNNWASQGWHPVVLGLNDAKKNPKYKEYLDKFRLFPTKNHVDYELACLLRWVAMEFIGEGFMCDYDVMNYGFNGHREGDLMMYTKNVVPCVVYGTEGGFSRMLNLFMQFNGKGKDHISDQSILVESVNSFDFKRVYLCTEYREEGNWYNYPLVHYPYSRTDANGLTPRWKFVNEFNELIKNLRLS